MAYDFEELKVVFFRHKFKGNFPKEDIRKLWENRQVALHWGNSTSTDPSDYENSTAQSEIRRLNKYGKKGAIMAVYYGNDYDIHRDEMLVGVVPPETTPVADPDTGFKTLQMDEKTVRRVSFKDYPVLSAVRPRGHSLCRWHAAEDQVRTIIREGKLPASVESLSPSQLEVACDEFLRVQHDGYFPVLPIGRTLRDVDIVGGTGEKCILAQVTQASDVESKVSKLQKYAADDTQLVFFGTENAEPESMDNIEYVTVSEVFDTLYADEAQGRKMLDRMLNPT